MHTRTHTCTYAHMHTHMHVCTHAHRHARTRTHTHIRTHLPPTIIHISTSGGSEDGIATGVGELDGVGGTAVDVDVGVGGIGVGTTQ